MNAPGSPSSALQITYFVSPAAARTSSHFVPVGNPAPPRPRNPDCLTAAITSAGSSVTTFPNASYPPVAMYSSIFSGSIVPQLRRTSFIWREKNGISWGWGAPSVQRSLRTGRPFRKCSLTISAASSGFTRT